MEKTFVKGKVNPCCEKQENLELKHSDKPELIIKKCKVCGRRQFRLMVQEAIKLGSMKRAVSKSPSSH